MNFHYRLSPEEIQEAVLAIEWKKQKKFHGIHFWIISLLGCAVLTAYVREPAKLYLLFVLAVIVAMLMYLAYAPLLGRKQKVRTLIRSDGEYRLEIEEDFIIVGNQGRKIDLAGRTIRAVHTDHLYVVQTENEWFAIPVRLLDPNKETQLREILRKQNGQMTELLITK